MFRDEIRLLDRQIIENVCSGDGATHFYYFGKYKDTLYGRMPGICGHTDIMLIISYIYIYIVYLELFKV